jgi:hypothetical protein
MPVGRGGFGGASGSGGRTRSGRQVKINEMLVSPTTNAPHAVAYIRPDRPEFLDKSWFSERNGAALRNHIRQLLHGFMLAQLGEEARNGARREQAQLLQASVDTYRAVKDSEASGGRHDQCYLPPEEYAAFETSRRFAQEEAQREHEQALAVAAAADEREAAAAAGAAADGMDIDLLDSQQVCCARLNGVCLFVCLFVSDTQRL